MIKKIYMERIEAELFVLLEFLHDTLWQNTHCREKPRIWFSEAN